MKVCLLLGCMAALAAHADPLDIARQALADGLPDVAIHQLHRARLAPDEQAAGGILLGRALVAAGRFVDAAAGLEPLAARSDEAKFFLAEAHAGANRPDLALPLYEVLAGGGGPFATDAAVGRSRALGQLGRNAEAIDQLRAFLETHPHSAPVALALAARRLDAGDVDGASHALAAAGEIPAPLATRAAYLRGRILLALGRTDEAAAALNAISHPPADLAAGIVLARAEARDRAGEEGEAEQILEAAIGDRTRIPGTALLFAALDRLYASQSAASMTELRRWAADDSDPARAALAVFYLGLNEARSGDFEKAQQSFREFLRRDPQHVLAARAQVELASSLFRHHQPAEALAVLTATDDPNVNFLRGVVLAAQGQYPGALAAFLQAADDDRLVRLALSNAVICALFAGDAAAQDAATARLRTLDGGAAILSRLRYVEALHHAARREPNAAAELRAIAEGGGPYAPYARLALAEWEFQQLDLPAARRELARVSSRDPALNERTEFFGIFVADTGDPDSEAQVLSLAQAFLNAHPGSPFLPDVRMKIGEILFRRGDYLGARGQFSAIVEARPGTPLAETALFLSAQALARSMDPKAMEEAIEVYESVAQAGGPLAARSRLAQAVLFNALGNPGDAVRVLNQIVDSKAADPDLHNTALIEKGDTLLSQGAADPANIHLAIAAWKTLAEDPNASTMWRNQALTKMGGAYEKLGQPEAALDAYYAAFSRSPGDDRGGEPDYFWYYKAGFDAGRLLDERKQWKEAIAVYEKMASVDGPRAAEARDRANRIRLENFIWE